MPKRIDQSKTRTHLEPSMALRNLDLTDLAQLDALFEMATEIPDTSDAADRACAIMAVADEDGLTSILFDRILREKPLPIWKLVTIAVMTSDVDCIKQFALHEHDSGRGERFVLYLLDMQLHDVVVDLARLRLPFELLIRGTSDTTKERWFCATADEDFWLHPLAT